MSRKRDNSLRFYEYLCQNICSEEDVKVRRLTSIACDIGNACVKQIRSGSNGEGLYSKDSDLDLMLINHEFSVYEHYSDISVKNKTVPLVMDTDDTQPCFTKLRIVCNRSFKCVPDILAYADHKGRVLSSKMFKQIQLGHLSTRFAHFNKIHGPCLTDNLDQLDIAICIKCDKWISHVDQWVKRVRRKCPTPDVISKMLSCCVLFVPVGVKESINEHIKWRMSFSVAEKILICSFNHTQLLCYALLKIFLKEIIDNDTCLKGLLCSYFIKTLMFWILEESDSSKWRPDNIILCFQACIHKLLYCIDYEILSHYFIPEKNLFHLRFNGINRNKLSNLLKISYQQGEHCLFSTKTLRFYPNCSSEINQSLRRNGRLVNEIRKSFSCGLYAAEQNKKLLLSTLLHYSRSGMSADIFTFFLSHAHQMVPQYFHIPQGSNKQKYIKYKNIISHLLIGIQSDAVTGWIMLASFFYEQKYYFTSLFIINHALFKCTDDNIQLDPSFVKRSLNRNQINALNIISNENLMTSLKTLTINILVFAVRSSIIPTELQLDVQKRNYTIHPKPFAQFLAFLCCFHLKIYASCNHFMHQLLQNLENMRKFEMEIDVFSLWNVLICIGIALQMSGETKAARDWLEAVSMGDVSNLTSAKVRLSEFDFND